MCSRGDTSLFFILLGVRPCMLNKILYVAAVLLTLESQQATFHVCAAVHMVYACLYCAYTVSVHNCMYTYIYIGVGAAAAGEAMAAALFWSLPKIFCFKGIIQYKSKLA